MTKSQNHHCQMIQKYTRSYSYSLVIRVNEPMKRNTWKCVFEFVNLLEIQLKLMFVTIMIVVKTN